MWVRIIVCLKWMAYLDKVWASKVSTLFDKVFLGQTPIISAYMSIVQCIFRSKTEAKEPKDKSLLLNDRLLDMSALKVEVSLHKHFNN